MNTKIKFYIKNRFMNLLSVWVVLLMFCCINSNANVNGVLIAVGFVCVVLGFSYMIDKCKYNAQERLFVRKLNKLTFG